MTGQSTAPRTITAAEVRTSTGGQHQAHSAAGTIVAVTDGGDRAVWLDLDGHRVTVEVNGHRVCRHGGTGYCWDDASATEREHFEFLYRHAWSWASADGQVDPERAERYAAHFAGGWWDADEGDAPSHRIEFWRWLREQEADAVAALDRYRDVTERLGPRRARDLHR